MDDPTVNWSKERYDEIESKMIPFLKSSGYNVKKVPPRDPNGPLRMPIIDKFKDMGTVTGGKIESGSIREGDNLLIMPNKAAVKVLAIFCDEDRVRHVGPGENVRVRLSGVEEDDILSGFVLCSVAASIPAVTEFVAQHKSLSCWTMYESNPNLAFYYFTWIQIAHVRLQIDLKTRKPMKKKPLFVKNGAIVLCRVQVNNMICVEKFSNFAQLGRFTLRTEGKNCCRGENYCTAYCY
ncbi:hypothetical protein HAX54_023768 [Datura stramonium]|uniref:Uncharacterized protein n=1 Tax=Datura stramonium TaxID=4076 RepID=A0ABS8UWV2_DATST|nr:hypothetical protein [Datura stramonium]